MRGPLICAALSLLIPTSAFAHITLDVGEAVAGSTYRAVLKIPLKGEHGAQITEGVREIDWSGGKLPDDFYDEFVFIAGLPANAGATLYFPVVQECESGVNRWIEIPEAGKSPHDLKQPAPHLRLLSKP